MQFDHQLLRDIKAIEEALEAERRYERDAKLFQEARRFMEAEERAKKDADIVSGRSYHAQLALDRALAGISTPDFSALQKYTADQDRLEAFRKSLPTQEEMDAITGANKTPEFVDLTTTHLASQKKAIAVLVEKEVKRQLQQRDADSNKSNDD